MWLFGISFIVFILYFIKPIDVVDMYTDITLVRAILCDRNELDWHLTLGSLKSNEMY